MKEEIEYLGFDVGYGGWKPAASKMLPLQVMQIGDDPKKGLHDGNCRSSTPKICLNGQKSLLSFFC